jgi:hypothetical protein
VGGLTGAPTNTRKGTFSFWIKFEGGDGQQQNIGAATMVIGMGLGLSGGVTRLANGHIRFQFNQCLIVAPNLVMDTKGVYNAGGWHHVAAAWDLDGLQQIYVDGKDDLDPASVQTAGGAICYNADNWYIGGTNQGATLNADVADMYSMFGTFIDLRNSLGQFRTPAGKPVALGPNCVNVYNGMRPIVCLSGNDGNTWSTNKGTGGGMTVNGGTLAASTGP